MAPKVNFDIVGFYLQKMAEAELAKIDEDFVRMSPEAYPAEYAKLLEADEKRERDMQEHRKTCTCPYCDI